MPIPSSPPISGSDIEAEFGANNLVDAAAAVGLPAPVSFSDFAGLSSAESIAFSSWVYDSYLEDYYPQSFVGTFKGRSITSVQMWESDGKYRVIFNGALPAGTYRWENPATGQSGTQTGTGSTTTLVLENYMFNPKSGTVILDFSLS